MNFKNYDCTLKWGVNNNGRLTLDLVDSKDGSPIATATANAVDSDLTTGEIIIKNYSENEGMYDALLAAGIIRRSHRRIGTGHIYSPVCYLTPLALAQALQDKI